MTEAEWLACDDPGRMLGMVHGLASNRKLRLFAVASFRGESDRFSAWKEEVEAVERFADGQLTAAELDKVLADIYPMVAISISGDRLVEAATSATLWRDACAGLSQVAATATGHNKQLWHYQNPRHCTYIREIFGRPPFRSDLFDLAWRTSTVTSLAETIYADRAFDRLPILADALEDAGCTDRAILDHCRQPGEHVRGCWVVDLVLGKA